jgi:hypothetical protein
MNKKKKSELRMEGEYLLLFAQGQPVVEYLRMPKDTTFESDRKILNMRMI